MTDWDQVAAGIDQAIELEKIRPVLQALEKSLAPLVQSIPRWADTWTAPEDVE